MVPDATQKLSKKVQLSLDRFFASGFGLELPSLCPSLIFSTYKIFHELLNLPVPKRTPGLLC